MAVYQEFTVEIIRLETSVFVFTIMAFPQLILTYFSNRITLGFKLPTHEGRCQCFAFDLITSRSETWNEGISVSEAPVPAVGADSYNSCHVSVGWRKSGVK